MHTRVLYRLKFLPFPDPHKLKPGRYQQEFEKSSNTPGPSPGFCNRRVQRPKGGLHFQIQHWMYATAGRPNMKWGAQILNEDLDTTGPLAGDGPITLPQTSNLHTPVHPNNPRMSHSHCYHPTPAIVHLKTTKISCNVFHRLLEFIQWFISKNTVKQKCETFLLTLSISFSALKYR